MQEFYIVTMDSLGWYVYYNHSLLLAELLREYLLWTRHLAISGNEGLLFGIGGCRKQAGRAALGWGSSRSQVVAIDNLHGNVPPRWNTHSKKCANELPHQQSLQKYNELFLTILQQWFPHLFGPLPPWLHKLILSTLYPPTLLKALFRIPVYTTH